MFRFTIRDVLWLTVLVALAVGWWLDHAQIGTLRSRCVRLEMVARATVNVLRELGQDAEFKDDNIYLGASHWPAEDAPWNRSQEANARKR